MIDEKMQPRKVTKLKFHRQCFGHFQQCAIFGEIISREQQQQQLHNRMIYALASALITVHALIRQFIFHPNQHLDTFQNLNFKLKCVTAHA